MGWYYGLFTRVQSSIAPPQSSSADLFEDSGNLTFGVPHAEGFIHGAVLRIPSVPHGVCLPRRGLEPLEEVVQQNVEGGSSLFLYFVGFVLPKPLVAFPKGIVDDSVIVVPLFEPIAVIDLLYFVGVVKVELPLKRMEGTLPLPKEGGGTFPIVTDGIFDARELLDGIKDAAPTFVGRREPLDYIELGGLDSVFDGSPTDVDSFAVDKDVTAFSRGGSPKATVVA